MHDVIVNYLRASHSFIVRRRDGVEVASGIGKIEHAWEIADAEQGTIDQDRFAVRARRKKQLVRAEVRTG